MKKCQELALVLADEYRAMAKLQRFPQLELHLGKDKKLESFSATCQAGILDLHADGPLAQAYALSFMTVAVKSGHLADYLGTRTPKFALRPLWLGSPAKVAISKHVHLNVPEFMLAEDRQFWLPRFCKRLLECGYNSVMIGAQHGAFMSKPAKHTLELNEICQHMLDHGIQLIVKPNFYLPQSYSPAHKCPYDKNFVNFLTLACSELAEELPQLSYIFWESMLLYSNYRYHSEAKEATVIEIVLEEVRLLESILGANTGLIFYIPSPNPQTAQKQAAWIPDLLDDLGPKTVLAFSAVAGEISADHQLDHPLWKVLRLHRESSATPLLPIVNLGAVQQGEGLWPIVNFDLCERFIPRCQRHNFLGLIGFVNHLPKQGSWLDNLLWVAGHSLWHSFQPHLLAESWFKAFYPNADFNCCYPLMEDARKITLRTSSLYALACSRKRFNLTSEEWRLYADEILAQLKLLQLKCERYFKNSFQTCTQHLQGHFNFFIADIKRFIDNFWQFFHLPAINLLNKEEIGLGFWSQTAHKSSPPTTWFYDEPQRGAPGSDMEVIFSQNRLL